MVLSKYIDRLTSNDPELRHLQISLDDSQARQFAEALPSSTFLHTLDLSGSRLNEDGWNEIAKSIQQSKGIVILKLLRTNIPADIHEVIVKSISYVGLPLPLQGVHVNAHIFGTVAKVEIVQIFVNPYKDAMNLTYVFPLDDAGAIFSFQAVTKNNTFTGRVMDSNSAQRKFRKKLKKNEPVALLEENSPDTFRLQIGCIPPQSPLKIIICYATDLKVSAQGIVSFVLPTAVAPRYSRGTPLSLTLFSSTDHELTINQEHPGSFSVQFIVEMFSDIIKIQSETHSFKSEIELDCPTKAKAKLSHPFEPMGKDLVINIHQKNPLQPFLAFERKEDGSGCAMLSLIHDFSLPEKIPVELVFLVDCSGSMEDSKMQIVIHSLHQMMGQLKHFPDDTHRFNIVQFGSSVKCLFSTSQFNNSDSFRLASNCLDQMKADMGGTELIKALSAVFSLPLHSGFFRQIFLLTDGEFQDSGDVLKLCLANEHQCRIFPIGIGDQVSRHLLESIARTGSGVARYILGDQLRQQSTFDQVLLDQFNLALQPTVDQIYINWGDYDQIDDSRIPLADGFSVNNNSLSSAFTKSSTPSCSSDVGIQPFGRNLDQLQTPFLPPPLFRGQKFTMFTFCSDRALRAQEVTLVAFSKFSETCLLFKVPLKLFSSGDLLHILAARAMIRDLEEKTSHLHWRKTPRDVSLTGRASAWKIERVFPDSTSIQKEIIHYGTRFGIASTQTSFVAYEQETDVFHYAPLPDKEFLFSRQRTLNRSSMGLGFTTYAPSTSTGPPNIHFTISSPVVPSVMIDPEKGGPSLSQWSSWGSIFLPSGSDLNKVLKSILDVTVVYLWAIESLLSTVLYIAAKKPSVTLHQLAFELEQTHTLTCINLAKALLEFVPPVPSTPLPSSVWSMENWLTNLQLPQYIPIFQNHKIFTPALAKRLTLKILRGGLGIISFADQIAILDAAEFLEL